LHTRCYRDWSSDVCSSDLLHHLFRERYPSAILKSFRSYSTSEGWAHYVEELMWDAGALGHDPRAHIAQLLQALLRDVRFLSAIEIGRASCRGSAVGRWVGG